ncbi:6-hydroxymethylpterin diphosphokinase MptE-like protein [Halocatena marina]|uniref:6-hydroxymethyl-7,8-dihydropterin pyrophosphokinase n=1 Tax=Halocatena marina TaxID=2934937 RepID=A0ABD5YMN6_9EURY|nr:6-hydroxymethylpterin diphosphokinase MptE-like protein [Halocatena marina]
MDFADWEPVYTAILDDFGFDRAGDERARDLLGDLTTEFDLSRLVFTGGTVAVVGGGPLPSEELARVHRADRVVAVAHAAEICRREDIPIDLVVTDLDTDPERAVVLTQGTPVAVAAHGDNIPALEAFVPKMTQRNVLGTTQANPIGHLLNVGGFTDGDRAAFIADHCGAKSLIFPGWDFDDPDVNPIKRRKLAWAERLLRWLEQRRNERFAVLDGRRATIDTTVIPD